MTSDGQIAGAAKIPDTSDCGDNWEHDVVVEKTLAADQHTTVQDCIGGWRALSRLADLGATRCCRESWQTPTKLGDGFGQIRRRSERP